MLSRLMTRKEQFLLLFVGSALLMGSVALFVVKGDDASTDLILDEVAPPTVRVEPPAVPVVETLDMEPPAPEPEIAVSIAGAVQSPGLYRFSRNARIDDLIQKAGDVVDGANVADINRAALLIDGTTLTIPFAPTPGTRRIPTPPNPPQYTLSGWAQGNPAATSVGATQPQSRSASGNNSGIINVNAATQQELETLPGIGPVYAAAIIEYRSRQPFGTVDELINVSGIGEKRLAAIRNLVRVR